MYALSFECVVVSVSSAVDFGSSNKQEALSPAAAALGVVAAAQLPILPTVEHQFASTRRTYSY
jgi:hypothetical protein